jgi:hypothetical protein
MHAVESNGINPLLVQRNKATSACHSVPTHHLRESECHDPVHYPLACVLGEANRMDTRNIYISSIGINPDQDQEQIERYFIFSGTVWSGGGLSLLLVYDNSV